MVAGSSQILIDARSVARGPDAVFKEREEACGVKEVVGLKAREGTKQRIDKQREYPYVIVILIHLIYVPTPINSLSATVTRWN